jgi:hypothetical protein
MSKTVYRCPHCPSRIAERSIFARHLSHKHDDNVTNPDLCLTVVGRKSKSRRQR